ncbi:MAG: RNA polymerase sigma factor SigZ [Gammaproteobacteria bacterium]|nr:RNA polymerase sigma factor SigZ [Gammaproteobacteria bacterium]MBL6999422.1 RNA polymerase sigma factor SigZ [Gammaproteobacteria bacterium]
MKCITSAWDQHESELRHFLQSRINDQDVAEDLLQDVFVKALAQGQKFCQLENTRAWLYRVTRNHLIDYFRSHKIYQEVPEQLPDVVENSEPLVNLSRCLPTALTKLSNEDREVIELCDLQGLTQAEYALRKSITLPGAKSRLQRARKRLKIELNSACKIIFDEQGKVCCFDPECQ